LPVRAAVAATGQDGDEVDELVVELFELGLDDDVLRFLVNREVLEDGEVQQPALGLAREVVGALPSVDEGEGFVEGGHDVVDLVPGGVGPVFDLGSLGGDAGLFGFQDVLRHGVAVVELDKLLLLGGQLPQTAGVLFALARATGQRTSDRQADRADALDRPAGRAARARGCRLSSRRLGVGPDRHDARREPTTSESAEALGGRRPLRGPVVSVAHSLLTVCL